MRLIRAIAAGVSLFMLVPATTFAQDHGWVDGFGGLDLNRFSSVTDFRSNINFGGRISVNLIPHVQAIGEFGRLGNVLPPLVDTVSSLTPFDIRASALYGEGGVRLLAGPNSAVSPYAEATAGFARLRFGVRGFGSGVDVVTDQLLRFAETNEPLAGLGGGIVVRGGPLVLDFGYRYKQIVANNFIQSVLGGGQNLRSNQIRVGVGVRF